MDSLWQIGLNPLMALTSSYTSGWTTASANFGVMEMYSNNNDCANSACSSSTTTPGGDVATNYDDSLGKLSQTSYIPDPGNGTNQPGDTPQEVLFIVTDGVEDEQSGSRRLEQTINDLAGDPNGSPYGNASGTNWCTTIKNRGIKIAILYTDYLQVTANSWYVRSHRTVPTRHRDRPADLRHAWLVHRRGDRHEHRNGPRQPVQRGDAIGPSDPIVPRGRLPLALCLGNRWVLERKGRLLRERARFSPRKGVPGVLILPSNERFQSFRADSFFRPWTPHKGAGDPVRMRTGLRTPMILAA